MIGERLKKLRKDKNIRQEDLAERLGVQTSTVSLYETDKIDASDKVKVEIARYFNVSLDYLLGVIDESVPYFSAGIFMKLPDNMSRTERLLLSEFLELAYMKQKI